MTRPSLDEMRAALEQVHGPGWLEEVDRVGRALRDTLLRASPPPGIAAAALVDLMVTIIQTRACQAGTEEQTRQQAELLAEETRRVILTGATNPRNLAAARRIWRERMT